MELANKLSLLWLLSCQRDLSAHPTARSSTDPQNLLEYLWRCPSTDTSAAFVTLLEQSMALVGSTPFQTRVSVVSDLPSSVVLLD